MSDVRRCDECEAIGDGILYGWWRLENESLIVLEDHLAGPLDFCSWKCLGSFVFEHSGEVLEQAETIRRLVNNDDDDD